MGGYFSAVCDYSSWHIMLSFVIKFRGNSSGKLPGYIYLWDNVGNNNKRIKVGKTLCKKK